MKASAFTLLRRDKSASAKMVAMVDKSATVGRAHTPRAEGKIGRVPRKLSGVEPQIDLLTVRQSLTLPCQNFVALVVKAWKFLVKHRKHPSVHYAVNLFSSINWRKMAFLQPRMRSGLRFLENFSGVYPPGGGGMASAVRLGQSDARVAGMSASQSVSRRRAAKEEGLAHSRTLCAIRQTSFHRGFRGSLSRVERRREHD